jgi:hypothetical protein
MTACDEAMKCKGDVEQRAGDAEEANTRTAPATDGSTKMCV